MAPEAQRREVVRDEGKITNQSESPGDFSLRTQLFLANTIIVEYHKEKSL
jgi:hypothetical protein